MSVHSLAQNSEPAFWDVGAYKANVRRIRDGVEQLDDFAKMVKERLEIEQKYGKSLQNWHSKWASHVEENCAKSCVKSAWTDVLEEGKELSRIHLAVRDRCGSELINTIELFRKTNYNHSAIRGLKEAKEIDDEFQKAQKQWKNLYEKLEASKKAYYAACRAEKSAYIQMMNSRGDISATQEGSDKTRERHDKCREDVKHAKIVYETSLEKISSYNGVYERNMEFVFKRCQEIELKRLRFLMEMVSGFQNVLADLVSHTKLSKMHTELKDKISAVSEAQFQDDLNDWSQQHGKDVPKQWPTFEPYTAEVRSITAASTKKRAKKASSIDSGVVLTRQITNSKELPEISFSANASMNVSMSGSPAESEKTESVLSAVENGKLKPMLEIHQSAGGGDVEMRNRESPEITSIASSAPVYEYAQMRGPARVIWDYSPEQGDEISLHTGEILEVLDGPDDKGWCLGRKGQLEGLFPHGFVTVI